MSEHAELICPGCNELVDEHDSADTRACLNVLARRENRYICTNCDVGLPAKYRHCPACGFPGGPKRQGAVA